MTRLEKYINFYIGCDTNKGKLIGVKQKCLIVQGEDGITEYDIEDLGVSLFLHLQQLNQLSEAQSKELINRGIAIGRPNGYTFSNEGFYYLITLNVDLFGLIKSGYAKNIHEGLPKIS
jgi:hypothetical protein